MKQKQKDKLGMFTETARVLEKNKGSWNDIPEFKNAVEKLVAKSDAIVTLHKGKNLNKNKYLEQKTSHREALINKIIPISNVLQVYAFDTGNKGLIRKISFSRNKLSKLKDSELIKRCNYISKTTQRFYSKSLKFAEKLAKNNSASKMTNNDINAYGLKQGMIEDLERSCKAFGESILKVKDSIANKNLSLKKISGHFKQNERLLKYKIDKLMTLFESSDKAFYKSYLQARRYDGEAKQKPSEIPESVSKANGGKVKTIEEFPAVGAVQKSAAPDAKRNPTKQAKSPPRQMKSSSRQATPSSRQTKSSSRQAKPTSRQTKSSSKKANSPSKQTKPTARKTN